VASRTASTRKTSPSKRYTIPNFASPIWVAFSNMTSNTDARSPGDRLMTRKISAEAACWANTSSRSVPQAANRRRRSATSAGSAKLDTKSTSPIWAHASDWRFTTATKSLY
jgi:hypothetical protein